MNDFLKMLANVKKMADLYATVTKVAGIKPIMGGITPPIHPAIMKTALGVPRIEDFLSSELSEGLRLQRIANAVQVGIGQYQWDIHKAARITKTAVGFEKIAMSLMQARKIQAMFLGMNFELPDIIPHFKLEAYVSSFFSLRDTLFKQPIEKEDTGWIDMVDRVTAETSGILEEAQQEGMHAIVEKLDDIKNEISAELRNVKEQIAKPGKSRVELVNMFVGLLALLLAFLTYYDQKTAKPVTVTVAAEQVQIIRDSLFADFKKVLASSGRRAVVVRKAKLFMKPKENTLCIGSLSPGKEVIIINVLHKWVNISYISSEDQLPTTGWVQKKYLQAIQ